MARRRRAATTGAEADETPRLILGAARQLFLEHGYRAVTTRQVADACGLTQPALYHHFGGKEELYVAMLQDEIARMRRALERITRRDEPVAERLRRAALYMLTMTRHNFAQMQSDMATELGPASRATLEAAFMGGVVAPLATVFDDGRERGFLRGTGDGGLEPTTAAFFFLSVIAHFLAMADGPTAGHPAAAGLDAQAQLIVGLVLHGLAAPRGPGA